MAAVSSFVRSGACRHPTFSAYTPRSDGRVFDGKPLKAYSSINLSFFRSHRPAPQRNRIFHKEDYRLVCSRRSFVASSSSSDSTDPLPQHSDSEKSQFSNPPELPLSGTSESAALELEKNQEDSLKKFYPVFWILPALVLISLAVFLNNQPTRLMEIFSKSGFTAAFSLIFVSEIGDKTFFIAALLAMRHSRTLVLFGATSALAAMTIISVVLGKIFNAMPAQFTSDLPIGEWLAVVLLVYFGIRSIMDSLPPNFSIFSLFSPKTTDEAKDKEEEDGGELQEAKEFVDKIEMEKFNTPLKVFLEAFSLIFVAEWGDRSMLATVALAVAQNPFGVASGAITGHFLATAIAVVGGSFLSEYISERVIGITGGVLFLLFAVATALGVF